MKRLNVICILTLLLVLSGCQLLNQDPEILVYENFALEYEVKSKEPDWLSAIRVSDKEDGDLETSLVDVDASDVDMNKLGTYEVSYTVKDSKGSKTVKKIKINVVDTEKPVIALKGDDHIRVMIDFEFNDPGVQVSDNLDEDLLDDVEITSNVDTSKTGTYKIRYNVTDSSGNEADEVVRTITVIDDLSYFIDDDLEKIIRFYLNKDEGSLTKIDCAKIIDFVANGEGLTTIKGIEYLTQLRTLNLSNNQIVDLTPLAKLTKIEKIDLSNNLVTDLTPLSELTSLKWLNLQYNAISNPSPLKNLTALYYLNLANNELFDVSQLNKLNDLEVLRLEYNNIDNVGILKSLYLAGAFQSESRWVSIFQNPIDASSNGDSCKAVMYFIDHGINIKQATSCNPVNYQEDFNSLVSIKVGDTRDGYIGFQSDEDWFRVTNIDGGVLQLFFTKNEMLNVEVYPYNKETNDLGNKVVITQQDLVSESVLNLPEAIGTFYIKVSMKEQIPNFTYHIRVESNNPTDDDAS